MRWRISSSIRRTIRQPFPHRVLRLRLSLAPPLFRHLSPSRSLHLFRSLYRSLHPYRFPNPSLWLIRNLHLYRFQSPGRPSLRSPGPEFPSRTGTARTAGRTATAETRASAAAGTTRAAPATQALSPTVLAAGTEADITAADPAADTAADTVADITEDTMVAGANLAPCRL